MNELETYLANYVSRLQNETLTIFLFHGVVRNETYRIRNYTNKHLRSDVFSAFLSALSRHGTAISLDDVIQFKEERKNFPPYAYAITFDDGFENNLCVAAPMLVDFNIPATFYVATDFIESNRMSWIDRIETVFESRDIVRINVPWRTETVEVKGRDEQIALINEIRFYVKKDAAIEPDEFATDIQTQCGSEEVWSGSNALDKKLNWDQVRDLNSHSLFRVGGHTHNHAIMSYLSPDKLNDEIDTSLAFLSDRADVGPEHYSYPEGLAHCYSDSVIAALKKRGVLCCPTAEDGTNTVDTDLFRLRRVSVI